MLVSETKRVVLPMMMATPRSDLLMVTVLTVNLLLNASSYRLLTELWWHPKKTKS